MSQRLDGDAALAEFRDELGAAPDADARNRMRHTVLNATRHPRPVSRARFTMMTRRAVVGSVAALAVVGAVGTAVVAPHLSDPTDRDQPVVQGPPGVVVDADTGAPAVLELAAQRAATSSPVSIRAGQFVYTRSEGGGAYHAIPGKPTVLLRSESWTEIWYDPEGMLAVRIRGESGINVEPVTEADRAAAEQGGYLDREPNKRDDVIADYEAMKADLVKNGPTLVRPTAGYLAGFSTDPDRLLAELRAAAVATVKRGPEPSIPELDANDASVFASIANLFYTADAIIPPALRAAFYRVLVKLSGVERVPGEVTVGGRTGIAIAIKATGHKERYELVLDARTFTFIGTRSNPGQPVERWNVVTASAVVDAVGETA